MARVESIQLSAAPVSTKAGCRSAGKSGGASIVGRKFGSKPISTMSVGPNRANASGPDTPGRCWKPHSTLGMGRSIQQRCRQRQRRCPDPSDQVWPATEAPNRIFRRRFKRFVGSDELLVIHDDPLVEVVGSSMSRMRSYAAISLPNPAMTKFPSPFGVTVIPRACPTFSHRRSLRVRAEPERSFRGRHRRFRISRECGRRAGGCAFRAQRGPRVRP